MKIKDLFKQMENANKFSKMVGDGEWYANISIEDLRSYDFSTFKEFKKWSDEEYLDWYVVTLLEQEIELDQRGNVDCSFEYVASDGSKNQSNIFIAICHK